ncbi:uncharacterized protein LOC142651759 [Rhinoderma darwinii]|uniref:uncharacterized protein LOC142651759 n=1 Tax=Rhinoderma darwinii TaxID=43563 RepID=UPI003F6808E4
MSNLTLSYNQEQMDNILSQVTTSRDFLQTPPTETRSRDLEKTSRRLINQELHSATLAEYIKVQRIPRGLRMPIRPTIFKENPEYCTKFEQILNKCSFDLMVLTVSFLQKNIADLRKEVTAAEQQLRTTLSLIDFTNFDEKLKTNLGIHRSEIENQKRRKFQRDLDDYQNNRVYKWQEGFTSVGMNARGHHWSSESSLSGSGGEGSNFYQRGYNYNSHFLGRRRSRRPRRGRGEEANFVEDVNRTMATRSQTR